ncbi:MAG TPA: NAD(P)H-hydrate epimerase [Planctomycetota bacterium]|nr:NAD(P)H-hydrate epimerase [Planctomycetota bacterium]
MDAAHPSVTRAEARAFDRWAMGALGLPGAVLMENAARGAAEVALAELEILGRATPRVVVLCGAGNNGGDGYALARQLACAGVRAELATPFALERNGPDAALQRAVVERLGLVVREEVEGARDADLLVDALLGTGSQGELREPIAAWLEHVAGLEVGRRLALDLPSGLDCDDGSAARHTFRADVTVTFAARKRGFEAPGAAAWTGRVVPASIGVPFDPRADAPWRTWSGAP